MGFRSQTRAATFSAVGPVGHTSAELRYLYSAEPVESTSTIPYQGSEHARGLLCGGR